MATWHEITRDPEYQALSPQGKAVVKQGFFEREIASDPEYASFSESARKAILEDFWQTPDDSGQGYISSLVGSAGRGFGEVVPGAIEGAGALSGISTLEEAGRAVRGGLEYISPVNPLYEDTIPSKLASTAGQVGAVIGTGGIGGLTGKALAASKIAAGTTAAERAIITANAFSKGASTGVYGSAGLQGAAGGAQAADQYGMEGGNRYARILAGAATELGTELLGGAFAETGVARKLLGGAADAVPGVRTSTFTEAAEEGASQFGGNLATQVLAPEGVETPGLGEGVLESAALGGFGGALMGVAGKLAPTPQDSAPAPTGEAPPIEPTANVEIPGAGTWNSDSGVPLEVAKGIIESKDTKGIQSLIDNGVLTPPQVIPKTAPPDAQAFAANAAKAAATGVPVNATVAALRDTSGVEDLGTTEGDVLSLVPKKPVVEEPTTPNEAEIEALVPELFDPALSTGSRSVTPEITEKKDAVARKLESLLGLPSGHLTPMRWNVSKVFKTADGRYLKVGAAADAESLQRLQDQLELAKESPHAVVPELRVLHSAGIYALTQSDAGIEGADLHKSATKEDKQLFELLKEQNPFSAETSNGALRVETDTSLKNMALYVGPDGMVRTRAFDFDGVPEDTSPADVAAAKEVLAKTPLMPGIPLAEFSPAIQNRLAPAEQPVAEEVADPFTPVVETTGKKDLQVEPDTRTEAGMPSTPPQRDTTKPEQMTPGEYASSERDPELPKNYVLSDGNGNFVTEEKNGWFKVWRLTGTHATLAGTVGFKGAEGLAKAKARLKEVSAEMHEEKLQNGIRTKKPVSKAAVDAYGITLPEGYVKQGDLYVFQPQPTAAETQTSGVAVERDLTNLEQMTPDEVNSIWNDAKDWANTPDSEIVAKYQKQFNASDAYIQAHPFAPEYWRETQRKIISGASPLKQHTKVLNSAIAGKKPVSTAAVDAYKITLPEGYVQDGELYVYRPSGTVEAKSAPPAKPAPQAEQPAPQRDTSKPEQMTPEERRDAKIQVIAVETEKGLKPIYYLAIREGDSIGIYGSNYSETDGELIGSAKPVNLIARPTLEEVRQVGSSAPAYIEKLAIDEGAPIYRANGIGVQAAHQAEIASARLKKAPVSKAAVDAYGITLPQGYVKQGELYIFSPQTAQAAAETQTPAPSRKGAGAAGVVERQPTEGSIPVVESTVVQTPSVSSAEKAAKAVATAGKSTAVRLVSNDGRQVIVARDPEDNSAWRATIFSGEEPTGHEVFGGRDNAIRWVFGDEKTQGAEWEVAPPETPSRAALKKASDRILARLQGEGIEVSASDVAAAKPTSPTVETPTESLPADEKPMSGDSGTVRKPKKAPRKPKSPKPVTEQNRAPVQEEEVVVDEAPRPLPPKYKPKVGDLVSGTVNGVPVVGKVTRVSGGGTVTAEYGNGKEFITNNPVPAAQALATAPKYQYTQEQNTAKAARLGLPTTPGVTENAGEVIRNVLLNASKDTRLSPLTRAISRALLSVNFDGVRLRIKADGRSGAGLYTHEKGTGEIMVNLRAVARGQVDSIGVFLHEALHHATLEKLFNPAPGIETEAVDAIKKIVDHVKTLAGPDTVFDYELGSPWEFVSALFTRPDFQNYLASVPAPGSPTGIAKFRSALSELFRRLAELVTGQKVQKGSTMEQAIAATMVLFETPQRTGDGAAGAMADRDAEYMAAVEAGDMVTAQRVVDEAAKEAGYNVGPVWHGTKGKKKGVFPFEVFKTKEAGEQTKAAGTPVGSYFAEERTYADGAAMLASNFGRSGKPVVGRFYLRSDVQKTPGVETAVEYVATDPSQIKSADPVTRDDKGNIIPLSQRFNETSNDIRYAASTSAPATSKLSPDKARAILTKRFGKAGDKFVVGAFNADGDIEWDAKIGDGNITLNLKYLDTEAKLIAKAEHELAHAVFDDPAVQQEWKAISRTLSPAAREKLAARLKGLGYADAVLDEEMLVQTLEEIRRNTPPAAWQRFVKAVRDALLRLFGMDVSQGDAERAAARIVAAGEAALAQGLDPAVAAFGQSLRVLVTRKTLTDSALSQESWRNWYEEHQETLDMFFQEDAGLFQKILAVTSQAASVKANVGLALKAFSQLKRGEPFVGFLPAVISNLNALANETAIGGQKIGAYTAANEGDTSAVVVDRHIARMMFGVDTPSVAQFAKASKVLTEIAKDIGWTPRQVQAALWAASIVKSGKTPQSYGSYLRQLHSQGTLKERIGHVVSKRSGIHGPSGPGGADTGGSGETTRYSLVNPDAELNKQTETQFGSAKQRNIRPAAPQQETANKASAIIGEAIAKDPVNGRMNALLRFDSDTKIPLEVRAIGAAMLAEQVEYLNVLSVRAGNALPEATDLADDFVDRAISIVQRLGTELGRGLNIFNALARLTPEGFIRRRMRQHAKGVDEVIRQNFTGDLRGEIERLWKAMQDTENTSRGKAFAEAVKEFLANRPERKKDLEEVFKSIRTQMAEAGGESLVRDFFQMMAGPRAQAGPLAEFDASIQSALSGMLRKVMESKGLVAENQSVQATDIDKLVRSVSADALRFEKIAAADAAMQEELDKIEDPERRAVLQQAWEEATSKMYTNIASESTLRRAVNAELKETPIDWAALYDKNRGTDAEKRRVVAAVMTKVEALLTNAGDKNVQQNLDMLRSEVGEAFDQVAAIKRAQWLAGREAAESRRRTAERKAAFVEALKVKGISEKALLDLNAKLDLPARPGAERNEVSVLIGDNIKAPVEDFVAKLTALGVDQDTAEALDKVSVKLRAEYAEAARVAAIEALKLVPTKLTRQAIERLNSIMAGPMKPHVKGEVATLISDHSKAIIPDFVERMVALGVDRAAAVDLDNILKTSRVDRFLASLLKVAPERNKTAKEKLSKVIRTALEAGNLGAMDSQQFMDLFAKEFGLPPMTKEFKAEIKEMVRGINALPKGPARIDAIQALEEKLALWEGIKTRDVLMSTWYANILSGVSTQAIGLLYNNLNLFLKSAVTMLANPKSAKAFVQGALGEGLRTGLKEAVAALQGRGLYKVSKWGDKKMIDSLGLLSKQGPRGAAQWAAYLASAGTLTRKVFHLMEAVDALSWNTAREGHAYLAAHRALREELAGTNPTAEEFSRKFVEKLGGDTAQIEADMREARDQLTKAGKVPDLTTIDRMAKQMRDDRRAEAGADLQSSNRFADRVVVQQEPEGIGRFVNALITAFQQLLSPMGLPVGQMLIPFNKIVSNLFEQSLDYTPVGIVRGALGGHLTDVVQINKDGIKFREGSKIFDSTERWERAITGTLATSIGFALYALAASMKDEDDEDVPFMITAFGPTDKNKRSQMPKGWAPFTIKIGDVYYKFAEAPFGMMFAGIGSVLDAIRYEKMASKTATEKITYLMMRAGKGFMTQGVLSSVDTAIDVITGQASGKRLSDIPVSAMKGAIPGQGLLRDLSTLTDDRKIDGSTMRAALLRDIPFVKSYAGKPELNAFGEPVTFDGYPVVRRFVTGVEKNHVADYLGRNDLYIPGMPPTIEVGSYLPKEMKDRLQRRALEITAMENGMFTPDQNYEFKKRAGELTKRAVERIMSASPPIANDVQRKKVQSVLNKQIEIARKRAMLEAVPIK